MRKSRFFGMHAKPTAFMQRVLPLIPFVLLVMVYLWASHLRLEANPSDKLLPSLSQMGDAMYRYMFVADPRTGSYMFLSDTLASLYRLGMGIGLAMMFGLWLGLNMGIFPGMSAVLLAFITFVSIIPPLAILPMLFITVGTDEAAKITLIFIGTAFIITRNVYKETRDIPRELLVKALTLGATQLQVVYRVVLPQILPRLIDVTRVCLGGAWLFLIAAEAIASSEGLGYRIFLVRRYLAMNVIIPYVLWITFLGFAFDWVLRQVNARVFPWYAPTQK